MESYKYVALSLILLLSTPLATFAMEDLDDGVHLSPSSKNSIIPAGAATDNDNLFKNPAIGSHNKSFLDILPDTPASNNPPNSPVTPIDMSALSDEELEKFYTPRASIEYKGFEDFDKRSVDDLTNEQAYQALLKQIQAASLAHAPSQEASVEIDTAPASPSMLPPIPQLVMGAAAVGTLTNAIISAAAPVIRRARIDDETRSPLLIVTALLGALKSIDMTSLFKNANEYRCTITFVTACGFGCFEYGRSLRLEQDNKKLIEENAVLRATAKQAVHVNGLHEVVAQGLIATEHKVLRNFHDGLRAQALAIAKGSAPTQAAATLKEVLKINQKMTKKVVITLADLEKVHTDSASLLKDDKKYSIFNPMGLFEIVKNMCHKHSAAADADAAQ